LCCGLAVAAPAVAQDNAPAPPTSLADYRFVNAFVVLDPDNPLFCMHEFYVNSAGLDAFRQGGPYTDGAEFVGLVYAPEQDEGTVNEGAGKAIVLMRKTADAEDTGGWRFALVGADGARMDIDPVKDCFSGRGARLCLLRAARHRRPPERARALGPERDGPSLVSGCGST
jgi:hypothetical protein